MSALRAGSRKWPPRYETLAEAKTEKKTNKKTGRLAQHYKCASCGEEFAGKDVAVDHIDPVVDPEKGFEDWNTFIERLYCDKDNLQVLCKTCHDLKSKNERKKCESK